MASCHFTYDLMKNIKASFTSTFQKMSQNKKKITLKNLKMVKKKALGTKTGRID